MDERTQKEENEDTQSSFQRSTGKQVVFGLLTNFISIAPSMSLGFSAIALPALTHLTKDETSWFASIASLATPFGCIFSGPISDRFGRRTSLFCVSVICFLGWIIIAAAYYFPEYQYLTLLIGRLLTGLSTGLSSTPATVYMAEISTPKLRGVFCTWSSVSFAIGVLTVYYLGYTFKTNWGLISLIAAIFPVIGMLFAAFLIPESPSWLIRKNRYTEAKVNLCKIFGTKNYIPEVQNEIESLIKSRGVKAVAAKPVVEQALQKVRYLIKPNCLKPLYLIVTFFFFQQFAGTFVLVFYALDIVKAAGITVDPYLTIVLIGIIRLIGAMIVSYISKIYGRRPLSIISGSGMTISMVCLAAYILALKQGKVDQGSLVFIPMTSLLFYFFISTLGFLPMPFAMSAELFPAKIRGTSSGLAAGIGYFFNFITVKVYNLMNEDIGQHGIFFFYGVMSLLGTVFVVWLLPETKGKTLAEIEEYFQAKQDEKNVLLQKPKREV